MRSQARPLLLLFAGTTLWGISSAAISTFGFSATTTAPLVAAGGAAGLTTILIVTGRNPFATFRKSPSFFVTLGLLETLNLVLFMAALQIGPLPIVVALHLTAPILLITFDILRGRREVTGWVGIEGLLIVLAVAAVALSQPEASGRVSYVLGSALALGSAVSVAGLISLVANRSPQFDSEAAAAVQLTIAASVTLPLIWVYPAERESAIAVLAIGALLLGPGFALYWRALRSLDATMASVVGLNEAVIAAVFGALLRNAATTLISVAAGLLILLAVGMELRIRDKSRPSE